MLPEQQLTTALSILAKLDLGLAGAALPVLTLLNESKAAHSTFRRASVNGDREAAKSSLMLAAKQRALAEMTDPGHDDPAWLESAATHLQHRISHGEINGDLLGFYLSELSK